MPRHLVQLHKIDTYGPPERGRQFHVFTNKKEALYEAVRTAGNIVWLVCTEGQPRRCSIALRFIVDGMTPDPDPNFPTFRYGIIGKEGQEFAPPLPLTHDGLMLLAGCTNGFKHGLSELTAEAVEELERMVRAYRPVMTRAPEVSKN